MFYKCIYSEEYTTPQSTKAHRSKTYVAKDLDDAIRFAKQNYKNMKMICEYYPLSFDYPELPNAKNEPGRVNRLMWAVPYEEHKHFCKMYERCDWS